MESRAKLLGHPVHQMLVVFPLGLLVTAVIFDVVYFVNREEIFAQVAFWNIAAGLVGAVLAAATGLLDWMNIPRGTRARRIGLWHGLGNAVVFVLFVAVWFYRLGSTGYVVEPLWFVIELIAVGLGGITGWLGGELVDRLGVGVSSDANLNAPNSLSADHTS
jgi:uncharacterized membrane protein